jgi:tetratricopeptide (TPR) repeat protein
LIQRDPYKVESYTYLALAFRQNERLDEAMACFDELIQATPKSHEAPMALSWLLTTWPDPASRDPLRALDLAQTAVSIRPLSDSAQIVLAGAYYRNEDWTAANEAIQLATKLTGNGRDESARIHLISALVQWRLGQKNRAWESYRTAVAAFDRFNPAFVEIPSLRAEAAALLGIDVPQE